MQSIKESRLAYDVVFISVVLALYSYSFYYRWPLWEDQSVFHYMAWGLSHGLIPYVDAVNMNFPGIIIIHYFARVISGSDPFGLRLLDIFFVGILWMSTSYILASWKVSWPIRIAAFSCYIICYFNSGYIATAQRESFALPLIVLGMVPWLAC